MRPLYVSMTTLAAALAAGCALAPEQPAAAPPAPEEATVPYVRVARIDGRWWFVQGANRFLSLGVNAIVPRDYSTPPDGRIYNVIARYNADFEGWARDTEQRLRGWNFNTAGAWSHEAMYAHTTMYHTRVLGMAGDWGADDARLLDVFDPAYAAKLDEIARREVAPHANDTRLIGYFINNELPWYGERGWPTSPTINLLTRYLQLPDGAPGRARALAFLAGWYTNDFAAFARDWRTEADSFDALSRTRAVELQGGNARLVSIAWSGEVADRYFKLTTEAIRRHDPNHLVLGVRYAYRAPTPVMEACARYCDVISVNHYSKSGVFNEQLIGNIAALSDKPVLITEFSWRAMENRSDDMNTHGADVTVQTQRDRADRFRTYATRALQMPYLLGYHWFNYHDQPPMGRFDGENSNYGLVDIQDRPYDEITSALREINGAAATLHAGSRESMPALDADYLVEYRPVRVRSAAQPLPAPLRIADGRAQAAGYADETAGAAIRIETNSEALVAVARSRGWGCGLSISPNLGARNHDGSAKADGARRVVFSVRAPAGTVFGPTLNESGHGVTQAQTFDGLAGADGEAYTHAPVTARDGRQEYAFVLSDFERNPHYGNQRGNFTIDVQAIAQAGLTVLSHPGDEAKLEIREVRFE